MNFDHSFFLQLFIFSGLILILKKLYFDPILGLLHKREQMTKGKQDAASGLVLKIEALKSEYDQSVSQVRKELDSQRDAMLKQVAEAGVQQMMEHRSKMDAAIAKSSRDLEAELKAIRSKIPALSIEIKNEILSSMKNSKVNSL